MLPCTLVLMVAVSWHAQALQRSDHPSSRKRIRLANAGLMLLVLPLMATGLSLLSSERQPREWALVWIAVMGLVLLSVGLATLDALNTLRLVRLARRELGRSLVAPVRVSRKRAVTGRDESKAEDPPGAQ